MAKARDSWCERSALIMPDRHIDTQDPHYDELLIKVQDDVQDDDIILLGDHVEGAATSQHRKKLEQRAAFKREKNAANAWFDVWDNIFDWDKKIYLEGNHEENLRRYIKDNAPALEDEISWPEKLHLDERGWEWIPYEGYYQYGKVRLAHSVGHSGKTAVFQNLAAAQHNIITGHTHRAHVIYQTNAFGESHFSCTLGHGVGHKLAEDYTNKLKRGDYHQAFGRLFIEKKTGFTHFLFVPVIDSDSYKMCMVNEKIYKVKIRG